MGGQLSIEVTWTRSNHFLNNCCDLINLTHCLALCTLLVDRASQSVNEVECPLSTHCYVDHVLPFSRIIKGNNVFASGAEYLISSVRRERGNNPPPSGRAHLDHNHHPTRITIRMNLNTAV